MYLSQEIAQREFRSIDDITKYFEQNPTKLVQYVRGAIRVKASIPGMFLTQLSELMQVPLAYKGEQALISPCLWISPGRFSNISAIMSLARKDFPNE